VGNAIARSEKKDKRAFLSSSCRLRWLFLTVRQTDAEQALSPLEDAVETATHLAVTDELHALKASVQELRSEVVATGLARYRAWRERLRRRSFRLSALNLAAYIALRRHDLRALQTQLMAYGLSSLGRCEARVIPNLDAVSWALARLCGGRPPAHQPSAARFFRGEQLLRENTDALFEPISGSRRTRIMVTLPSEAASDFDLVHELVKSGMDCARINCAHEDAGAWEAMIENVRRASRESGRPCAVCADVAGPKLRTSSVRLAAGRDRVVIGDRIFLSAEASHETPTDVFSVGITLPEVLAQLRPGDSAFFDEGRIECSVDDVGSNGAMLCVRAARAKGEKLRSEKGLNFPDSSIKLSPLTSDDLNALDKVADKVDMIGYSFVKDALDVARLQKELLRRRQAFRKPCGIVLKIETAQAVRNLPELIVQSAGLSPTAVMIARGDLAIEIGYRRLAEMQEEILWLCEAAHVPVIWATQVLDYFVKKGRKSRAEFTDAAMAERADCVMLNKGPYVCDAVTILNELLARMEGHQVKKTSRLRSLHSW
jgi:pyruvate kinase